ncbi:glycosyltransferase family 2 protein [Plesiomonas sp. ZOR0011]|uniref:glycosyltransferase family 2 protein n=1 Tax=Plesiomonas sp. ZOR0011 TaxID=1339230 RepID=UPI0006454973|nr:glycosyltransferase family 2 protein [Plesiomonas sp. ZOR0011]
MSNIYLSIVIPVYRAADCLQPLYSRLIAVMTELSLSFEIIFVEDCGGDHSWDIISELALIDSRVHGLRMSRNYGQHNALLAGVRYASGEVIITLDDDLQHPPEEIPKLLSHLTDDFDVVYGPPEREQHGIFRDLASRVTKIALQSAMGAETARNISAFRVFRTSLRKAFDDYRSPSVNIDVLLTWGTTRFGVCPLRHDTRKYGESGYGLRKLLSHAFNMITGFSTIPLKIASMIGLLFTLFGGVILAYVVFRYLFSAGGVPGFPFLASIISIFSGAQLLALGIIGEYLGRIYQRSMERPAYSLRTITSTRELHDV